MTPPSIPIQDLLVHADFLRQLARDLVGPAEADDLAQDVWVQALRRPPDARGSLRGWLATAARNLRANRARGEARRHGRERDAARPEALPSTQDVLAREQVRESVVRAVLSMDEPFREALLLRYYVGLAPRDIARRLDVPPSTVRSRLSRGLERLRARLDGEHGERGTWSIALAPWLSWPARGTSVLGDLVAMKKTVSILVALVLCGLIGRVAWIRSEPVPPEVALAGAPLASSSSSTEPQEGDVADPVTAVRTPVLVPPAPATSLEGASRIYPAERGLGAVHGDVVDEADSVVEGVLVRARPHMGNLPPGLVIDDDRTFESEARSDDRGRFRFESLPAGPIQIEARHDDGRRDVLVAVVPAASTTGPHRLRLGRTPWQGNDVHVLVVDAEALPVSGALVEVFAWSERMRDHQDAERGRVEPLFRGTTDPEGRLAVPGLAISSGVVVARSEDGRTGQASLWALSLRGPRTDVLVEVKPAGAVRVRLTGQGAAELDGATLSLHSLAQLHPYYSSGGRRIDAPVAEGQASFTELPSGTYGVSLDAPGGARLVVPSFPWGQDVLPNSVEMLTVEVAEGSTAEASFAVAPGSRIRGVVLAGGQPVAKASVRAVIAPRTSNFPAGFALHGAQVWRLDSSSENGPMNPLSHVHATTDAEGRYELRGLQPGSYRVEVAAERLSYDRRMDLALGDGETVDLRHELEPAGVLQVAALGVTYLGVHAPGEQQARMLAITRDDIATFPGLPAGRWIVARFHSDVQVAPQPLGEATVVAGRTTWLDLRSASVRGRVHGVVLASGIPVEGAEVKLYPATVRTDRRGAFLLDLGREVRFGNSPFSSDLIVRHRGLEFRFQPEAERASDLEVTLELGEHELELAMSASAGENLSGHAEIHWNPPAGPEGMLRGLDGAVQVEAGRVRIGPLPAGMVHGTLHLDDGRRASFESTVPRNEPLVVEIPDTGLVRVRVQRDGRAVAGARVFAHTWIGAGAAPENEEAFFAAAAEAQSGRTDQDGKATLRVRAGEVIVRATRGGFEPARSERIRVDPDGDQEITIEID